MERLLASPGSAGPRTAAGCGAWADTVARGLTTTLGQLSIPKAVIRASSAGSGRSGRPTDTERGPSKFISSIRDHVRLRGVNETLAEETSTRRTADKNEWLLLGDLFARPNFGSGSVAVAGLEPVSGWFRSPS